MLSFTLALRCVILKCMMMSRIFIKVSCIFVLSITSTFSIIIINFLNSFSMSKSRYFRIRLFIDCGTINPKCVYDNIHVYTRLYSAKRAARSMALANYPPASWFVNEVATR